MAPPLCESLSVSLPLHLSIYLSIYRAISLSLWRLRTLRSLTEPLSLSISRPRLSLLHTFSLCDSLFACCRWWQRYLELASAQRTDKSRSLFTHVLLHAPLPSAADPTLFMLHWSAATILPLASIHIQGLRDCYFGSFHLARLLVSLLNITYPARRSLGFLLN